MLRRVLLWQVDQAITYDGKYSPMTMEHSLYIVGAMTSR